MLFLTVAFVDIKRHAHGGWLRSLIRLLVRNTHEYLKCDQGHCRERP